MVFGAEQPALFGRPRREYERSIGLLPLPECPRHLEHPGDADRVVGRAVTDAIAARVWIAHAITRPNDRRS
jgi:hypothetical protein